MGGLIWGKESRVILDRVSKICVTIFSYKCNNLAHSISLKHGFLFYCLCLGVFPNIVFQQSARTAVTIYMEVIILRELTGTVTSERLTYVDWFYEHYDYFII